MPRQFGVALTVSRLALTVCRNALAVSRFAMTVPRCPHSLAISPIVGDESEVIAVRQGNGVFGHI